MFTERDLVQIEARGLTRGQAERQMENFRQGFPFLPVVRAATVGDGIEKPDEKEAKRLRDKYRRAVQEGVEVVKFVPASGAATRMFKALFDFGESALCTVENVDMFAFREALGSLSGLDARGVVQKIIDYGAPLPKGLILFHKYAMGVRTAAEEHLVEGAECGVKRIHFTVSPEHEAGFRELMARIGEGFDITFSQQDPSTDTIAVTPGNEPFREEDGSLLFRPAGHGALIGNLDRIDADLIYIKNIDNVTVDRLRGDTVRLRELMGGMALEMQERIFEELRRDDISPARREELNRPLRICAMVRNEGEPGGGPFWVRNADGTETLQIAESSQIAPQDRHLFSQGTHFNPVDIVCAVRDHRGQKFDLTKFTDPATGFISEKTKDGRPLKAQELPGLWNGAMARWNTVFVEAPISTFTPVKEVNDLLRNTHSNG